MITTIQQVIDRAAGGTQRILAVAAAHDEDVLRAVIHATQSNLILPILVGDTHKIKTILCNLHEEPSRYNMIEASSSQACAETAVHLISTGDANFLMKGLLGTSDLMRAVVHRESGLRTGRLISHVALYETASYQKLLAVTDGGMNPYPDLEKKADILENAARMLLQLGYSSITAACVCGAEVADPKIPATIDAQALTAMPDRWANYGMDVIGPVGLDLAISKSACVHKGFHQAGGGDADILLVPTYEVGNAIGKTLSYFANAKSAGIILGAKIPIVLVSRADDAATKLASIALGSLLC